MKQTTSLFVFMLQQPDTRPPLVCEAADIHHMTGWNWCDVIYHSCYKLVFQCLNPRFLVRSAAADDPFMIPKLTVHRPSVERCRRKSKYPE